MQQVNKHRSFAGSSVYLFAAKLFPAVAMAFAAILYAHRLSPEAYGHYQNLWIQLLPLAALASAGIPVTCFSYTPAFLFRIFSQLRRRHISAYLLFTAAVALGFGCLQYYTNDLQAAWAALFFWLYIGGAITEALLLVSRTFKAVTVINTLYAGLFFGFHLLVLQQGYDLLCLLQYLCLLQLARFVTGMLLVRKQYRIYLPAAAPVPGEQLRSLKQLWLHMGINDLLQVSFRWLDKFLVSLLLIKSTLALYANATIDLPFLPLVFTAVSSAALQHWAHFTGKENREQVPVLHYSSRVLSAVVFPLFFFMLCFGHSFLYVVFSPAYTTALNIFLCAQLVLPVRAYPFMALLQQKERGDLINKGALIDLLMAALLMYPLYRLLGLPGIALSTVISTWWLAAYYLRHSARLLGQPVWALIPWQHLLRKALLLAALFVLARLMLYAITGNELIIFAAGMSLLILSGSLAVWYEWKKGKDFFQRGTGS